MRSRRSRGWLRVMSLGLATVSVLGGPLQAQRGGRGGPPAPVSPRNAAPVDLTGQWVSLITEEWRQRQFTGASCRLPSVRELFPANVCHHLLGADLAKEVFRHELLPWTPMGDVISDAPISSTLGSLF